MKKITDAYFSHQDYAPFLSYGPLKTMDENLSVKDLKTIKAGALKPSE